MGIRRVSCHEVRVTPRQMFWHLGTKRNVIPTGAIEDEYSNAIRINQHPRHSREGGNPESVRITVTIHVNPSHVITAKAGIQQAIAERTDPWNQKPVIPANAGIQ